MNNVWVVSYLDDNNEPQLMFFDNPLAANSCYRYYYKKYRNDVWIGKREVYGSFMVAGNEDE